MRTVTTEAVVAIATELEEKDANEDKWAAEVNGSVKITGDTTQNSGLDQNDLLFYVTIICIVLMISISSTDKSHSTPTILNINTLLDTIEHNIKPAKELALAKHFIDGAEAVHQVIQHTFQYGQHIIKQAPDHLNLIKLIKATVKEAFVLTLTEVEDAILSL